MRSDVYLASSADVRHEIWTGILKTPKYRIQYGTILQFDDKYLMKRRFLQNNQMQSRLFYSKKLKKDVTKKITCQRENLIQRFLNSNIGIPVQR